MTIEQIRKRLDTIHKILNFLQSLAYANLFSLLISMIFYSLGDELFYLLISGLILLMFPVVVLIATVCGYYTMWLEQKEKALSE